jgi:hypothetical protein
MNARKKESPAVETSSASGKCLVFRTHGVVFLHDSHPGAIAQLLLEGRRPNNISKEQRD